MSAKWRTMYDAYTDPMPVSTPSGDSMRPEYVLSVGKDGRKCLSKVRDVDISAYINSFAPGCDMAVILNKLQSGLISTDFDESNCVDLSLLPKDVVDAMQKTREFKDRFSDFPPEVQQLFDFDSNLFLQAFVDGSLEDALKSLAPTEPAIEPPPEPSTEPPKE